MFLQDRDMNVNTQIDSGSVKVAQLIFEVVFECLPQLILQLLVVNGAL